MDPQFEQSPAEQNTLMEQPHVQVDNRAGQLHSHADAQEAHASTSASLAGLPSRVWFNSYWRRSNKKPITYLATHDRTIAPANQKIGSRDSADDFQRMVKRVTGGASTSASGTKASTKRPIDNAQGGGPSKKGGAPLGAGPSTSAAVGALKAGPSTSAAAEAGAGLPISAAQKAGAGSAMQPSSSAPSHAPPAAAATLAAAVDQQGGSRRSFTQDELKGKSVRDLKELCKARSLQISGTKDQLVTRVVEHQRKAKKVSQPS